MNKEIAIKTVSLSKTYRLFNNKKDFIKEFFHPLRKKYHADFFALKSVSLEIKKGEVVGILGKNGSGKSTLLKILASVVTPSSGSYFCNGKVTGLLELGGGFNKEISGVENVKFMLAIMGFSKKDIPILTNEIIEFSEIGDYVHQPVKKYSSGMYMRLAFSLAININPDILIIDEILAVGDLAFKEKSFNKIKEFKEKGKTILLCTHSLSTIEDFCSKALWIHQGKLQLMGDTDGVIEAYKTFLKTAN